MAGQGCLTSAAASLGFKPATAGGLDGHPIGQADEAVDAVDHQAHRDDPQNQQHAARAGWGVGPFGHAEKPPILHACLVLPQMRSKRLKFWL